ncbi:hypothetical protein PHJA_000526500 [Phtheirospermum japonicum]|uniref:Myb/SANT-like domain-containing protein n=1 Tax=Phtheirospermum japonicum TaxID=374723 RepID=A0A830B807_9LAMI|nr:hypothetical protein PHJA_000526500 [Phtheirospermum japonicum]
MEDVRLGDISPPRPRVLFGEEATATINEGSSGSRSVNSPPRKLRKMASSSPTTFMPSTVGADAQWPIENEQAFVQLMYDEVVKGNVAGSEFTQSQWINFMVSMKEKFPAYTYTAAQLKGKCDRLKQRWKKYHRILTTASGFGWDASNGLITGSEESWAFWISANQGDEVLRRKGLKFYNELTTIFSPTTATRSMSRVSTQRLPRLETFDCDVEDDYHPERYRTFKYLLAEPTVKWNQTTNVLQVPNSVRRQFSKKWALAHHYFEHGDEDWDLLNGVFGLLEDLCAYPGEIEDDDARLIQRHNQLLHFIDEENATHSTGSNSVEGFEKRRQSNPTKAPGSSSKYYPVDGLSDRESRVGPVDSYMHWVRNLGTERSEEEETTLASDARWNDRQ